MTPFELFQYILAAILGTGFGILIVLGSIGLLMSFIDPEDRE